MSIHWSIIKNTSTTPFIVTTACIPNKQTATNLEDSISPCHTPWRVHPGGVGFQVLGDPSRCLAYTCAQSRRGSSVTSLAYLAYRWRHQAKCLCVNILLGISQLEDRLDWWHAFTEHYSSLLVSDQINFGKLFDDSAREYSFPNGPPGTARHRHGLGTARRGTGTVGTAARRAVPDRAAVPKQQPRHGPIKL